jgi:hypothetical protein
MQGRRQIPRVGRVVARPQKLPPYPPPRAGKAIRSPAKDVMLSHARDRPRVRRTRGDRPSRRRRRAAAGRRCADRHRQRLPAAFLTLALPGAAVMVLLVWLRARVPDPARFEPAPAPTPPIQPDTGGAAAAVGTEPGRLPRTFWTYLAFTMATTACYATFGVIAFHLAHRQVLRHLRRRLRRRHPARRTPHRRPLRPLHHRADHHRRSRPGRRADPVPGQPP